MKAEFEDALTGMLEVGWRERLSTKHLAQDQCKPASLAFIAHLRSQDLDGELHCGQKRPDGASSRSIHYIVLADGMGIDRAIRQFRVPDDPIPRRGSKRDLLLAFLFQSKVDLDDADQRHQHRIPDNWEELGSLNDLENPNLWLDAHFAAQIQGRTRVSPTATVSTEPEDEALWINAR